MKKFLSYSNEKMYKLQDFMALFHSVPLPFNIIPIPESVSDKVKLPFEAKFYRHKMQSKTDACVEVLEHSGFENDTNPLLSHILIGRSFIEPQLKGLNDFQKCSHFLGTNLIGTKCDFNYRMKELSQRLGYPVPFYPNAYYPPDDYEELLNVWKTRELWILKAPALSRAREINIVSSKEEEAPKLPYIVEEYITDPYLITGRKFDIRIYAIVTSICPLTIYFHNNGLALFATHKYDLNGDIKDNMMHITNYEINKNSETFVACDGTDQKVENSKWSLPFLWDYLEKEGVDVQKLKKEIEYAATSAIIAGICPMRNLQFEKIPHHRKSCFELLGVDILLDKNLKPYILEINISPGMHIDTELDKAIKYEVMSDTLNIARIFQVSAMNPSECRGYFEYEREYLRAADKKRRVGVLNGLIDPWENPTFAEYSIVREFIEEQYRKRNFYRVYPKKKNFKEYEKCFDRYIYEDIVLQKWISMEKRDRFESLINNFDFYYHSIHKCYHERDTEPPPSPEPSKDLPTRQPPQENKNKKKNPSTEEEEEEDPEDQCLLL